MRVDPDELAGVVDLFGALTREELSSACADLAARSGETFDADALEAAVDRAIEGYYLVDVERGADRVVPDAEADGEECSTGNDDGEATGDAEDDEPGGVGDEAGDGEDPSRAGDEAGGTGEGDAMLVAGPAALPRLPAGGEDLPHLVDVDRRTVDPETVAHAALSRLHGDAARAVNDGDDERVETLLDVCYELEVWAPVETETLRGQLDAAR